MHSKVETHLIPYDEPRECQFCGKTTFELMHVYYARNGYKAGAQDRFVCEGECEHTAKIEIELIYGDQQQPYRLADLEVREISLVDRAPNQKHRLLKVTEPKP